EEETERKTTNRGNTEGRKRGMARIPRFRNSAFPRFFLELEAHVIALSCAVGVHGRAPLHLRTRSRFPGAGTEAGPTSEPRPPLPARLGLVRPHRRVAEPLLGHQPLDPVRVAR